MIGDDTLVDESTDRKFDENQTAVAPPASDLHECLASETRRRILSRLLDRSTTSVDDLVDFLAGQRVSETREPVESEERERIHTRLYHVHLPQLDDAGLLVYDTDSEEVHLSTLAEQVREMIRFSVEYEQIE